MTTNKPAAVATCGRGSSSARAPGRTPSLTAQHQQPDRQEADDPREDDRHRRAVEPRRRRPANGGSPATARSLTVARSRRPARARAPRAPTWRRPVPRSSSASSIVLTWFRNASVSTICVDPRRPVRGSRRSGRRPHRATRRPDVDHSRGEIGRRRSPGSAVGPPTTRTRAPSPTKSAAVGVAPPATPARVTNFASTKPDEHVVGRARCRDRERAGPSSSAAAVRNDSACRFVSPVASRSASGCSGLAELPESSSHTTPGTVAPACAEQLGLRRRRSHRRCPARRRGRPSPR